MSNLKKWSLEIGLVILMILSPILVKIIYSYGTFFGTLARLIIEQKICF